MATVKFNLREQSRDKDQPVYLVFRHQNLRVVYATGVKVSPKYWSIERQRVKNVTNVPEKDKINNLLNDLEAETMRFAVAMMEQRVMITGEEVKAHLDAYTGRRNAPAKSLFGFIEKFIETSASRILPDTGKPVNPRTLAKYRTTMKALREFARTYRRGLDFQTIDVEFYNDWVTWFQNQGFALNYIGKHIQVLKTFLNEATTQGINTNLAYKSRYFKVMKEESESVYLTADELEALYRLDLSANTRLDRVRDLFLVGTWTGLRFSDFTSLGPEHIQGDNIEIEQFKTRRKVVIPVHPMVRAILDKYNGKLPASISNQKMNDYLKEVCQLAAIEQPIIKGITKGGARVAESFKKWEMVTTHTARRSFATNAYLAGIPTVSIMQITGHSTETAFLKYIKLNKREHAEIVRMHWQKSSNNLKVI